MLRTMEVSSGVCCARGRFTTVAAADLTYDGTGKGLSCSSLATAAPDVLDAGGRPMGQPRVEEGREGGLIPGGREPRWALVAGGGPVGGPGGGPIPGGTLGGGTGG